MLAQVATESAGVEIIAAGGKADDEADGFAFVEVGLAEAGADQGTLNSASTSAVTFVSSV
jgi:hypothetical protein